ncbi:hypothetical protein [Longirhabdus pacifica]|uniref:hypothetical protein n=1 Tax=Longirhabdus pacifica TaxID=2305227 RepID=UPI001008FA7A|nr:hypothetical protein [Longirhabdus pacifica]
MKKWKKVLLIIISILLMFAGIFSLTFIPHKIITIDPSEVSKIEIFSGNSGDEITVTNENQIEHIISNLNEIRFQKNEFVFWRLGYDLNITIYNKNGKRYKEFIMNGNESIRYNFFIFEDNTKSIDYDYIDNLFDILEVKPW